MVDGRFILVPFGGKLSPGEPAVLLYGSFSWSGTPQGADYWSAVYKNLMDLEVRARIKSETPLLNAVLFGSPDDDPPTTTDL